ncbi:hypothetical protein pb186bvf_014385 [Paramecium bursaria]
MIILLMIIRSSSACVTNLLDTNNLNYQYSQNLFLNQINFWIKYQQFTETSSNVFINDDGFSDVNVSGIHIFNIRSENKTKVVGYIQANPLGIVIQTNKQSYFSIQNTQLDGIWYQVNIQITQTQQIFKLGSIILQDSGFSIYDSQITLGGYGQFIVAQIKHNLILFRGLISFPGCLIDTPEIQNIIPKISNVIETSTGIRQFQLYGWVKVNTLSQNYLFQIISRQKDLRTVLVGDDIAVLKYAQTQITLNMSDYDTPFSQISSQQTQTILQITMNPLIWHILIFTYDNQLTASNTHFEIRQSGSTKQLDQQINIFDYLSFIVQMGQWDFQVSNIQIQIQSISTVNTLCHFTCLTCDGPTELNCLSCPSNRVFVNPQCVCPPEFYSITDEPICSAQLDISNEPYEDSFCLFGQFMTPDFQCYQCPFQILQQEIICADCFLYTQWYKNPQCTYDYQIIGQNYLKVARESNHYDVYLIDDWSRLVLCIGCLQICQQGDQNCNQVNQKHMGSYAYILCKPNFYFNSIDKSCEQCDPNCQVCNLQVCSQCKPNYYYSQNKCIECDSVNCQVSTDCDKADHYCLTCPQNCKSFQYYDGLLRCISCIDGFYTDGLGCVNLQITNCDYEFFYSQDGNSLQVLFDFQQFNQVGCAKCSTNRFNFQTNLCETNALANCQYSIVTIGGAEQCLMPLNQVCGSNCIYCINNYLVPLYCFLCQTGYYADLQSGQCILCPQDCSTCAQRYLQNDNAPLDYIIPLYQQYGSSYFDFIGKLQDLRLVIVCLSCSTQNELYQGKCILKCPDSCQICIIKNSKNICTECKKTDLFSENCVDCPDGCSACQQSLIQKPNSLISKYFNQCYLPINSDYFYDSYKQIFAPTCDTDSCQNILTLNYNVYCDSTSYNNAFQSATNKQDFNSLNYDLLQLSQQSFYKTDNNQFFINLNNNFIQIVNINLMLIPLNGICTISNKNSSIYQIITQNVFSVSQVNLIITSELPTSLMFNTQLNFINFTSITIDNLKFLTNTIKKLIVFDTSSQINLKNVQFVGIIDQTPPQILFKNCNNILLENLLFQSVQIQSIPGLFQINSKSTTQLSIHNIQLTSVTLISSIIFNFTNVVLDLDGLKFVGSSTGSNLFIVSNSQITMNDVSIINTQLAGNSAFFNFQSSSLDFNLLSLSTIQLNQILLQFDNIHLQNSIFEAVNIMKSILFANQLQENDITIQNLTITDCQYGQQFSFMNLDTQNGQITIDTIILKSNSPSVLKTSYSLSLMSGTSISINNVIITSNEQLESIQYNWWIRYYCLQFKSKRYPVSEFSSIGRVFKKFNLISIYFELLDIQSVNLQDTILIQIIQNTDYESVVETIEITASKFGYIIHSLTESILLHSFISIQSQFQNTISFSDNIFLQNAMNKYSQDGLQQSSTLIYIDAYLSEINMIGNQITFNMALNTTDSIIYLRGDSILLDSNYFENNNNPPNILSVIQYTFSSYTQQSLYNLFPIVSKSGNGYLIGQYITIINCDLADSASSQGAGFTIISYETGMVLIQSVTFTNLIANLFQLSYGGALYIDASSSKLSLNITSCSFSYTSARIAGGAIYILPSEEMNTITLSSLTFEENCAGSGSILHAAIPLSAQFSIINIQRLVISLTADGTHTFFQQLQSLTSNEAINLAQKSYLFYIQYGILQFTNIQIRSLDHFSIMMHEDGQQILINNLKLHEASQIVASLFKIYITASSTYSSTLSNLHIEDLYNDEIYGSECQSYNYTITPNEYFCGDDEGQPDELVQDELDYAGLWDCNTQKIYKSLSYQLGIIEIGNNYFSPMKISNLIVERVTSATWSVIQAIKQSSSNQLSLTVINSFIFKNTLYYIYLLSDPSQFSRLLATATPKIFTPQIQFQNISIHQNTVITYMSNNLINVQIFGLTLTNNTNTFYGFFISTGAQQTCISNTTITYNNQNLDYVFGLSRSAPYLGTSLVLFNFNKFQKDFSIRESIWQIKLSMDDGKTFFKNKQIVNGTQYRDYVIVEPYKIYGTQQLQNYILFPSGSTFSNYQYFDQNTQTYLSYNFSISVSLFNRLGQLFNLTGIPNNIQVSTRKYDTTLTNQSNFTSILNVTYLQFNLTVAGYKLNNLNIQFDPKAPSTQYQEIQIKVISSNIPTFRKQFPYDLISSSTDYALIIQVRSFDCQIGEIYAGGICQQCDATQNQYQVLANQTQCLLKDDVSMSNVTSAQIQLKVGFWRYVYKSTKIEDCYHLVANCQGGWYQGDKSCVIGHIGALCEQCDIYNTRGDGHYSVSTQYSCGDCTIVQNNALIICFISIWTITCCLITVQANIEDTNSLFLQKQVKAFGIVQSKDAKSTILIKMFTNYIQILSSIFTFQLSLPPTISLVSSSAGNPIKTMLYSLDCFLYSLSNIDIIYLHLIWALSTPFFYILFIYVGYLLLISIKFTRFSIGVITTTMMYIYIYMQPDLVQSLISLLSRRNLSDYEFIQGNVAYLFNTNIHYKWCIALIMPALLIVSLIIPLSLFQVLYKNNQKLDSFSIRQRWGYLYNEYRKQTYYWESVKIQQKQLIIFSLSYYEDQIAIKASILLLIVFTYQLVSSQSRPYYSLELNGLDTFSNIVCSISIIMASAIYAAQQGGQQEVVWPFYLLMAILNGLFILNLVFKILFAYLDKYQHQFDKIRDYITKKIPHIVVRYPFLQPYLKNRQKQQHRIKKNFNLIREYLLKRARHIRKIKKQFPIKIIDQKQQKMDKLLLRIHIPID